VVGVAPVTGRGSWTAIGGTAPADIGGHTYGYYQLWSPLVGSQVRGRASVDPDFDDYRAVWAGVKAIQTELNRQFSFALATDGTFGQATHDAVVGAQKAYGLSTGYTPGRVGPTLAKRLFRDLVLTAQQNYQIPNNDLGGLLDLESNYDPACVGEVSDLDNGIAQFHVDGSRTWWLSHLGRSEETISHAKAFDAAWAIDQAGARMAYYRERYAGKGADLQRFCSLASHNAPGWSDQWYATGTAPNASISTYVQVAIARAAAY
jgi:hypothetical protein